MHKPRKVKGLVLSKNRNIRIWKASRHYLGFTNSAMAPCVFLSSWIQESSSRINCTKNKYSDVTQSVPTQSIEWAYKKIYERNNVVAHIRTSTLRINYNNDGKSTIEHTVQASLIPDFFFNENQLSYDLWIGLFGFSF